MKNIVVSSSILNLDEKDLINKLTKIENVPENWVHIDVIEEDFAKNKKEYSKKILRKINKNISLNKDVHLMTFHVKKYIKKYIKVGPSSISIHPESIIKIDKISKTIKYIKSKGIKAGIVLSLNKQINYIRPYLVDADIILVMSVPYGQGGQKFNEDALLKIRELDKLRKQNNYKYLIEVDGGINNTNAKRIIEAGADALVSGNYIFKNNINEAIKSLRNE